MEGKNYLNLKFVEIANKWNIMSDKNIKCCENKCINTDKPIGNCIKGNGFINLIDGENIKYIKCSGKGKDKVVGAVSENEFKKPKDTVNYSLCYFEIKSKIEGVKSDKNVLAFGLRKNNNRIIKLDIDDAYVLYKYHSKLKKYKLPTTFSLNNNDTFGKALLLKNGDCDSYKLVIAMECCSVETNFGNDLKTNPFIYDISKHYIPKEFYVFDAEESDSDDSDNDMIRTMRRMMIAGAVGSAMTKVFTTTEN